MYNNEQIAVGIVIDKNKENSLKLINQLQNIFHIDDIIIIENQKYNLNIKNDFLKINYIKNDQYGNIIKSKNKILKFCHQRNIDNIFIINDNINILNSFVFAKYVLIKNKFNLNFLSFDNNDITKEMKELDIKFNKHLKDDFILINNNILKYIGFFDENFDQNTYLYEFFFRIILKDMVKLNFISIPDVYNSKEYLNVNNTKLQSNPNFKQIYKKHKLVEEQYKWLFEFNEKRITSFISLNVLAVEIKNKPQYKTIMCAIAKNENEYLDEWIQYYFQLGFNQFIIYENNCKIHLKQDYSNVQIIEWNYDKQPQQLAYTDCLKRMCNSVDFIAFYDIDEFLYIKNGVSLQQFLREYSDCFGIAINWRTFGDNGLETVEDNNYKVLPRFTKCAKNLREEVKVILNCNLLKEVLKVKNISFQTSHYINWVVNNLDKEQVIGPFNKNINKQDYPAQIYHFSTKTKEEFLKFKAYRGRADLNTNPEYKYEKYWKENNTNDLDNFTISNSLDRTINNRYIKFTIANGSEGIIKFEHLNNFNFEQLIKTTFKLSDYNFDSKVDKEPLVTVSIFPPENINGWSKNKDVKKPYILYTKIQNDTLYFYVQFCSLLTRDIYCQNIVFLLIYKMLLTSILFKDKNILVIHGLLLKNGLIIIETNESSKFTFIKKMKEENKDMIVCYDNILISFIDNKLIAQPIPSLLQKDTEHLSQEVDFNSQIQIKNFIILKQDKGQQIFEIDKESWKHIFYLSCVHLIYQPFIPLDDICENNFIEKWIDCREGLRQKCQNIIKQLNNIVILNKYYLVTMNSKDKKINKQIKEFLSLD